MIGEHVSAVLARLEAHETLAGRVVDGGVDETEEVKPPPYVVVYVDSGQRSTERLANANPERADFYVTVKSVGEDRRQAHAFVDAVMEQFLGWKPTVAGYRTTPLQHGPSFPPSRDSDFRPAVFEASDDFTFTSRKT
jgi:hypothetical protein